jgi:hypothetical protein
LGRLPAWQIALNQQPLASTSKTAGLPRDAGYQPADRAPVPPN